MKLFIVFLILLSSTTLVKSQLNAKDSTPSFLILTCCNISQPDTPYNQNLITDDIKMIKQLNKLPNKCFTISDIEQLLPDFLKEDSITSSWTRDLDFDLKSTNFEKSVGYGTYYISTLIYNDSIIKYRISLKQNANIVLKYLRKEMKLPYECFNGIIGYEKTNLSVLKSYEKNHEPLFLISNDTIYKRKYGINYLADVFAESEFENPFFTKAGLSRTFDYIRYFLINNDIDALQKILYSPNPTGRMFAAKSLLYLQDKGLYNPDEKIRNKINIVIQKSKVIRLVGPDGEVETRFPYNIIKDFDKYLKTE